MRHSLTTTTLVAAMFLLGLSAAGFAMESKSGAPMPQVEQTETIYAVDENAHFETTAAPKGNASVDIARDRPDAQGTVMSKAMQADEASSRVILEEHDYILYP